MFDIAVGGPIAEQNLNVRLVNEFNQLKRQHKAAKEARKQKEENPALLGVIPEEVVPHAAAAARRVQEDHEPENAEAEPEQVHSDDEAQSADV